MPNLRFIRRVQKKFDLTLLLLLLFALTSSAHSLPHSDLSLTPVTFSRQDGFQASTTTFLASFDFKFNFLLHFFDIFSLFPTRRSSWHSTKLPKELFEAPKQSKKAVKCTLDIEKEAWSNPFVSLYFFRSPSLFQLADSYSLCVVVPSISHSPSRVS